MSRQRQETDASLALRMTKSGDRLRGEAMPLLVILRGAAAQHPSFALLPSQHARQIIRRGDDDQQTVDAVEQAAVAGDDGAAILDADLAFQQRLRQVTE